MAAETNGSSATSTTLNRRALGELPALDLAGETNFDEKSRTTPEKRTRSSRGRSSDRDEDEVSFLDDSLPSGSPREEDERYSSTQKPRTQTPHDAISAGLTGIASEEESKGNDRERSWHQQHPIVSALQFTGEDDNHDVETSGQTGEAEESKQNVAYSTPERRKLTESALPPKHPHSADSSYRSGPSSRSTVRSDGSEQTHVLEARVREHREGNDYGNTDKASAALVAAYTELKKVIPQKSHRFFWKKYKCSFSGRKAVKYLLRLGYAKSKEEAVVVASELVKFGYIIPVKETHGNIDCNSTDLEFTPSRMTLYRFYDPETTESNLTKSNAESSTEDILARRQRSRSLDSSSAASGSSQAESFLESATRMATETHVVGSGSTTASASHLGSQQATKQPIALRGNSDGTGRERLTSNSNVDTRSVAVESGTRTLVEEKAERGTETRHASGTSTAHTLPNLYENMASPFTGNSTDESLPRDSAALTSIVAKMNDMEERLNRLTSTVGDLQREVKLLRERKDTAAPLHVTPNDRSADSSSRRESSINGSANKTALLFHYFEMLALVVMGSIMLEETYSKFACGVEEMTVNSGVPHEPLLLFAIASATLVTMAVAYVIAAGDSQPPVLVRVSSVILLAAMLIAAAVRYFSILPLHVQQAINDKAGFLMLEDTSPTLEYIQVVAVAWVIARCILSRCLSFNKTMGKTCPDSVAHSRDLHQRNNPSVAAGTRKREPVQSGNHHCVGSSVSTGSSSDSVCLSSSSNMESSSGELVTKTTASETTTGVTMGHDQSQTHGADNSSSHRATLTAHTEVTTGETGGRPTSTAAEQLGDVDEQVCSDPWYASLPKAARKKLDTLSKEEREKWINKWREIQVNKKKSGKKKARPTKELRRTSCWDTVTGWIHQRGKTAYSILLDVVTCACLQRLVRRLSAAKSGAAEEPRGVAEFRDGVQDAVKAASTASGIQAANKGSNGKLSVRAETYGTTACHLTENCTGLHSGIQEGVDRIVAAGVKTPPPPPPPPATPTPTNGYGRRHADSPAKEDANSSTDNESQSGVMFWDDSYRNLL
eukprot:gb/GECG01001144.1/.p1 GENE.gb/GECG01001144.1/~~gb/GECG01001144.1/.p1  ORF type:complete len:1062 (+),score=150.82 gb/GECG01001144.1/:1-3186(+)